MKSIVTFLFVYSFALVFIGCTESKKESGAAVTDSITAEEAEHHEHETDITTTEAGKPQFTVDEIFQQQLASVFSAYVALKEAFVSSDVAKVKKEAIETKKALEKVDMKLVTGAAHHDWMSYHADMQASLKTIETQNDIEVSREAFSDLTEPLYKSIKAYGLAGTTAYYDFCPMAFDDKGGYWLSENTTIRNPYFGDRMLKCGEVREKLQ